LVVWFQKRGKPGNQEIGNGQEGEEIGKGKK
jgi:hypothetical protein